MKYQKEHQLFESPNKHNSYWAGGKTAMKILQFPYDDEIPLMKRKWDKFVKFLSNKALPLTHIGLKKIMIFW